MLAAILGLLAKVYATLLTVNPLRGEFKVISGSTSSATYVDVLPLITGSGKLYRIILDGPVGTGTITLKITIEGTAYEIATTADAVVNVSWGTTIATFPFVIAAENGAVLNAEFKNSLRIEIKIASGGSVSYAISYSED
jgi:hypothetical protein